jgi:hypothetical protein
MFQPGETRVKIEGAEDKKVSKFNKKKHHGANNNAMKRSE